MFHWSLKGLGSTSNLRDIADNSVFRRTFVAWINPQTFLDLAYKLDRTNTHENSIEFLTEKFNSADIIDIAIPQLNILKLGDDFIVTEHEGRHRCSVAISVGIKKVPVAITLPYCKIDIELIKSLSNCIILSQDRKYEFLRFNEFWIDGSLYYLKSVNSRQEWLEIEVPIEKCLFETGKKSRNSTVKNPANKYSNDYQATKRQLSNAKKLGVTIKPSTNSKKKLDVFDINNGNKLCSIGASGYMDYDLHLAAMGKKYADNRRRLYKIRHEKDRNNAYSPGFYADRILW